MRSRAEQLGQTKVGIDSSPNHASRELGCMGMSILTGLMLQEKCVLSTEAETGPP